MRERNGLVEGYGGIFIPEPITASPRVRVASITRDPSASMVGIPALGLVRVRVPVGTPIRDRCERRNFLSVTSRGRRHVEGRVFGNGIKASLTYDGSFSPSSVFNAILVTVR